MVNTAFFFHRKMFSPILQIITDVRLILCFQRSRMASAILELQCDKDRTLLCSMENFCPHKKHKNWGPVMGYPLTAKCTLSFTKPTSPFRGGRWDNIQSDLRLPFLLCLFLFPMVILEFPTGTVYVPLWSHRANWGSTCGYDAPHKSPSFKQKRCPLKWGPHPLPLRRRTKNKSGGAWWPRGWKSSQNSCRRRKIISATWISASRKWFSPWERSRWAPGVEEEERWWCQGLHSPTFCSQITLTQAQITLSSLSDSCCEEIPCLTTQWALQNLHSTQKRYI